jgi:small subunit ribosomal protein S8
MVMTDPIADMLTIIRNGLTMTKEAVTCPHSKMKEGVLNVLKTEGYIANFKVMDGPGVGKSIKVYLKYGPNGEKVINRLERISKPGRRMYSSIKDLAPVRQGMGICVLSTPKGVVSDREARAQNVGGEVLCRVW